MPNYPIWSRIPKDEFIKYVNESHSLREIAQKCGYSIKNTGNYLKSIKDGAKFYNLSLDHLDGRGKNSNKYLHWAKKGVKWNSRFIKVIIDMREHKCERCQSTTWLDKPITLEAHHKDGDNTNNELENIELLCPNCHSYTENWRNRKK